MGRGTIELSFDLPANRSLVGVAQPSSRLNQRIENCLQIECRTADDLEHVGGSCLLLQGLGQILGMRLHFVEQAHIADCNHGLIGESLQ